MLSRHATRLFRLFCLSLTLAAGLSSPALAQTQPQLGDVARVFDFHAAKVVADPVRDRAYALLPDSDSVAVIDTTTLTVTATVSMGLHAEDLSVSPDGSTLYTANAGSANSAVGVVDLATLQARPALSLPAPAYQVAAGLGGRLYVLVSSNTGNAIHQVSAGTGAVQTTLNRNVYTPGLALTPDGRTLFVSSYDFTTGTTLTNYDVSSANAAKLGIATVAGGSYNNSPLSFSHNSQFVCSPNDEGNRNGGTALYSTADLASPGAFSNAHVPGPVAFSADDTVVYQVEFGKPDTLNAYSVSTFARLGSAALPDFGGVGNSVDVAQTATDRTGSYVFAARLDPNVASNNRLVVLTTGTGPLAPAALLPVLTLETTGASVTTGVSFTYQIQASHHPASYGAVNLPPGLMLDAATGIISGVATTTGNYTATLTAANAVGSVSGTLTFTVSANPHPPVITSALNVSAPAGADFRYKFTFENDPNFYQLGSVLPPGLSFNSLTTVVSGTPTVPGVYPVIIEANNNFGQTTATVTFTITADGNVPVPVITSPLAVTVRPRLSFVYQLAATNHPTLYGVSGPQDFRFDQVTRQLSGSFSEGTYTFTLTAANAGGTDTETLTITVAQPENPVPYFIYTEPTAAGQVGHDFGFLAQATDSPYHFDAIGLPPGLIIDPDTGYITGAPTQAGIFPVTLQATNANGVGTFVLTITILPDLPRLSFASENGNTADATDGAAGQIVIYMDRRLSSDLIVRYTISGSARNGVDYKLLTGHRKIKAGAKQTTIRVKPLGNLGGASKRTIKLQLTVSPDYFLGDPQRTKIKIVTHPLP